jgi:hypothetical protein
MKHPLSLESSDITAVPTLFEQEQLFWHIVIVFDGVILRKHL